MQYDQLILLVRYERRCLCVLYP